ncbi:hypothetical protein [Streptosporangium canum]|uniref:hypothetical protein n=1 Tax=Streptosporangium canum TaxID=324952 RepID=UPI000AB5B193|nr:hypothetical protein [Streptosporangium canum]
MPVTLSGRQNEYVYARSTMTKADGCFRIRRYIIWRNRHADDRRLRAVVGRANVA